MPLLGFSPEFFVSSFFKYTTPSEAQMPYTFIHSSSFIYQNVHITNVHECHYNRNAI